MRAIVQRVVQASVRVGNECVAEIDSGLLLFVGVAKTDRQQDAQWLAQKILRLRVFADEKGKMNIPVLQAGGRVLSVSQFTVYGDVRHGNRPGFDDAALPPEAEFLWKLFNEHLRQSAVEVRTGIFGAEMMIFSINNGPATFIVESPGNA